MALGSLFQRDGVAAPAGTVNPLAPKKSHFEPTAKRVIYLHLTGSPPHLDLFDYKPELVKRDGQPCPQTFLEGKRFAFTSGTPKLLGTPRKFAQYGEGGMWMSDAIPHLHEVADELCVIKSMNTDQFNHAPAELSALHRLAAVGPAFVWGLGDLRAGFGKRKPARLRRADLLRRAAQRRQEFLRQRVSAFGLSRRAMPIPRRPGAVCVRPGGHGPGTAAVEFGCPQGSE